MCVRGEAVYPVPRDLLFFLGVGYNLLHLRLVSGELGVTQHALRHGRQASMGTNVGADVAIDTLHPELHVRIVRKRDGLFREERKRAESHEPEGFAINLPIPDQTKAQTDSLSQHRPYWWDTTETLQHPAPPASLMIFENNRAFLRTATVVIVVLFRLP